MYGGNERDKSAREVDGNHVLANCSQRFVTGIAVSSFIVAQRFLVCNVDRLAKCTSQGVVTSKGAVHFAFDQARRIAPSCCGLLDSGYMPV